MTSLPPVAVIRRRDTHRLVPSRHLPRDASVLADVIDDESETAAVMALDALTNDRLLAADGRLPGIGPDELVSAVPHADVINAAFCHAHPLGARFSGPDRGAWYAAFELATSQAEVAFHKSVQLAEIDRFVDSVTYDDYMADVSAAFHDVRRGRAFAKCLDPRSYVESQALASRLLTEGSLGVVYPSVRRRGGTCLACFRPAIVANVRRGRTYRFTWDGTPNPTISVT
ncbi:MAG TPA: RES family NAD+ phosphorylase [Vicinamibacterales bacterium]|nr:RES family NAD+ phosphorylase [Vicinamibacterales bacterium]